MFISKCFVVWSVLFFSLSFLSFFLFHNPKQGYAAMAMVLKLLINLRKYCTRSLKFKQFFFYCWWTNNRSYMLRKRLNFLLFKQTPLQTSEAFLSALQPRSTRTQLVAENFPRQQMQFDGHYSILCNDRKCKQAVQCGRTAACFQEHEYLQSFQSMFR